MWEIRKSAFQWSRKLEIIGTAIFADSILYYIRNPKHNIHLIFHVLHNRKTDTWSCNCDFYRNIGSKRGQYCSHIVRAIAREKQSFTEVKKLIND